MHNGTAREKVRRYPRPMMSIKKTLYPIAILSFALLTAGSLHVLTVIATP